MMLTDDTGLVVMHSTHPENGTMRHLLNFSAFYFLNGLSQRITNFPAHNPFFTNSQNVQALKKKIENKTHERKEKKRNTVDNF